MSSLNQVMLIGNLGKDPEVLKSTELGIFVRLSLATSKKFKNRAGEVLEDTQWHTVYLNNGLGKSAAAHLKTGAKVFISGELRTHDWQDKTDVTHRSTAIYAKEMKFFSIKLKSGETVSSESMEEEGNAYTKAMQDIRDVLGKTSETE